MGLYGRGKWCWGKDGVGVSVEYIMPAQKESEIKEIVGCAMSHCSS